MQAELEYIRLSMRAEPSRHSKLHKQTVPIRNINSNIIMQSQHRADTVSVPIVLDAAVSNASSSEALSSLHSSEMSRVWQGAFSDESNAYDYVYSEHTRSKESVMEEGGEKCYTESNGDVSNESAADNSERNGYDEDTLGNDASTDEDASVQYTDSASSCKDVKSDHDSATTRTAPH